MDARSRSRLGLGLVLVCEDSLGSECQKCWPQFTCCTGCQVALGVEVRFIESAWFGDSESTEVADARKHSPKDCSCTGDWSKVC